MSAESRMNLFDLLGQAPAVAENNSLPGENEPKLAIAWGEFHHSRASCLWTLLTGPAASKEFLAGSVFRDSWIERRLPFRALVAAALCHVAIILLPMPKFFASRRNPAIVNTEVAWTGPIVDLPLVQIPAEKPKTAPPRVRQKAPEPAFHPRQLIFTDPVHPNHPRQTLINPQAPQLAPKILPNLPNIVELAAIEAPARPKVDITEEELRRIHPLEHHFASTSVAAPSLPNMEKSTADLSMAMTTNQPARPKLELNAGSAPRLLQRRHSDTGPAPEIGSSISPSSNRAASTFIALSATPGPPAPVIQRPRGNLAARISISPEGKRHTTSSGDLSRTRGGGSSPVGVSISGGNPRANTGISGLSAVAPKLSLPSSPSLYSRPVADPPDDPVVRKGPPDFADLPPGAKPELIFGSKRVYTMNINMPNLSSASGSWIIHFSELLQDVSGPRFASKDDVVAPVPYHKVDPEYPPTLMAENVEGDVILYAIIRSDGSVDSIQLVHGVDPKLDANAMHAFSQWKFRPAEKNGKPIALEAIVHIPFRAPAPEY
jgi:TonB family protein